MDKNKVELEKIDEIINGLEHLKQEVERLQKQISETIYEEDIKHFFDNLFEITNVNDVNSVIFVNDNDVKYISKPKHSGSRNLLIIKNKIYYWDRYDVDADKYTINLMYLSEYDLPDNLLNLLKITKESNLGWAYEGFVRLYLLLKKGYKINFIKVQK